MSKKLYFDIETIPAPEESKEVLQYLYQRKEKKFKEKKNKKEGEEFMSFEDFYLETNRDGSFGRILCISLAIDDGKIVSICNPSDERRTLEKFWEIAANVDLFVGHNIRTFDLTFIYQRSIVLGVKPTWKKYINPGESKYRLPSGVKFLDFARYINCPVFDIMCEWTNWGESKENKGLEHIAMALGFPTPKDGIDGSQVWDFYKAGKVKEICDYCERDVITTRDVYKRMVFEDMPDTETLPF